MTQNDLAEKADVSANTVIHLEKGGRKRTLTMAKFEPALEWEEGSMLNILDGGEPVEIGRTKVPEQKQPILDNSFPIDRPQGLSDADWSELQDMLRGVVTAWIAARRR